jgi:hypothetical protein
MELTLQQFHESAHQLVELLDVVKSKEETCWALSSWTLKGDKQSSSVYLSHPPMFTSHNDRIESSLKDDDFLLEDDTILLDPQLYSDTQNGKNWEISIQWDFSIVYSDTYRVPVLYFRVQTLDGAPCERSQVLQWLPRQSIEDSWDFISQEEHPFTGLPSFFLHPCRTSTRLKQLKYSNDGEDVSILWAWMSMIFPAVNQAVPPSYFRLVLNQLDEKHKHQ